MRLISFCAFAFLSLTVSSGCPRYTTHLSKTLGRGDIWRMDVEAPPRYQQKVKIAVNSPSARVSVYVAAEDHAKDVQKKLELRETPARDHLLASAEKVQEEVLEAVVPGRKGYTVFVSGADDPADVKITISGN